MSRSKDQLVVDRGKSMERTLRRYSSLQSQKQLLQNAGPLAGPLYVIQYPDTKLFGEAWNEYQPAVPINFAGVLYGGFGAFLFGFFAQLFVYPFSGGGENSSRALYQAARDGQRWR